MSHTVQLLELLENAYRTDLSDEEWIDAVLTGARGLLDRGLGLSAYLVDASRPDAFETACFGAAGADAEAERARFEVWSQHAPVQLKRHAHLAVPVSFASQLPAGNLARAAFEESFELTGYADVLGITALDVTGRGCALAIPDAARQTSQPPDAELALWERTAAHLATALRLRRRLGALEAGAEDAASPEAILSPGGRVEHAAEGVRGASALERLREAAVRFDAARAGARQKDALELTAEWRALVGGRWTLVDQFERDGRRYIVARPNLPRADALERLTERETQAVRGAAMGHSNKLIAYELGIAPSTVSTRLRRAAEKLGVPNRLELVRLLADRFGAADHQ